MGMRTEVSEAANAKTLETPEIKVKGYRVEYYSPTAGSWRAAGVRYWVLISDMESAIEFRDELQLNNPGNAYRVVRVLEMTEVLPI